jgi:DNA-binding PadR family transcriptional regulator
MRFERWIAAAVPIPEESAVPDIDAFLPLRPVEFHVLLSLNEGARHGYGIMQDAQARTGEAVIPDVGTLYRALHRMVEGELIAPSEAPDGGSGEARRSYYRITPLGRQVAVAEARRLDALLRTARAGGLLEPDTGSGV